MSDRTDSEHWQRTAWDWQTRALKAEAALQEIVAPVKFMQERAKAEGVEINGIIATALADDPEYLRGIARASLTLPEEIGE